jgi:hypothetical protein
VRTGLVNARKLHMQQRIELEKRVIGIIKRRMEIGIVVAVRPSMWAEVASEDIQNRHGHAYAMCAHVCLNFFGDWLGMKGRKDDAVYFFESGHHHQPEANRLMHKLNHPLNANVKKRLHYSSHSFVEKRKIRPLQAADLLAWQFVKYLKDEGKRPRRADFDSLLERTHILIDPTRESLNSMVRHTLDTYASRKSQAPRHDLSHTCADGILTISYA